MSAAVIRKRSHFEEQQDSPPRTKRLRPAHGGSPVRSPNHAERVSLASVAEAATLGMHHGDMTSSGLASTHMQSETDGWVEHLVKEMLSARDLNDAHVRGKLAVEAIEKAVASRSTAAVDGLQKENADLKEKMQVMLREGHILKRAVAIQHERQQEHEGRTRELQQAKQVIGQYQEQVRSLELNNYALQMHLRMAQDTSSMPGRYHPDVY
ncbi:hypothetical protein M758_9G111200 [Ceratodon purpureus]|uniref:Uncharacterized protein n=1 Tax=Ceratodon purpureus TaxID=3225 RepID=A0A8T0GVX0_CERPU|nr:hypothetical protein KC19_9G096400 [Ceratodon purpureus]KAG0606071.1 hypothetical protein M758_9G111200 [Ceratodon purpureus]